MKLAIPPAILTQHVAVIGKTGSGKTSTAKLMVEQIAGSDFRVCILDPIKSDWWGITSSADGKHAGLPFTILGGPRGHVPLHSSSGKAIGEIVGTGKLPLSIIDMADFEAGGIQRFFVDFAEALFKSARGVLYLVIEEAHEFAPKERSGFGAENMAIHWAKKLATGGRSKGFRLIVATQRVQALHNTLLGSCDTLIEHRLTAPADQEPIKKWLLANAPKETAKAVTAELSSMPTGTAWIVSGEAQIFERVQFPRIKTFDNSRTPDSDDDFGDVKTAPVDKNQLTAIIGDAVAVAKANDPAELKKQIETLRREMSQKSASNEAAKSVVTEPDPETLEAVRAEGELAGFESGFADGIRQATETGLGLIPGIQGALDGLGAALRAIAAARPAPASHARPLAPAHSARNSSQANQAPPAPTARTARPRPARASAGGVSPALQRTIDAIAFWNHIGTDPVPRDQACVVAGYSPKASTFGVRVAEALKLGLVETSPGCVALTAAGREAANSPTASTKNDLFLMARGLLSGKEAEVFDVIYRAYPNEVSRDRLADETGYSRTASTLGVRFAEIAKFGLAATASPGHVKASDWLFPR